MCANLHSILFLCFILHIFNLRSIFDMHLIENFKTNGKDFIQKIDRIVILEPKIFHSFT